MLRCIRALRQLFDAFSESLSVFCGTGDRSMYAAEFLLIDRRVELAKLDTLLAAAILCEVGDHFVLEVNLYLYMLFCYTE